MYNARNSGTEYSVPFTSEAISSAMSGQSESIPILKLDRANRWSARHIWLLVHRGRIEYFDNLERVVLLIEE